MNSFIVVFFCIVLFVGFCLLWIFSFRLGKCFHMNHFYFCFDQLFCLFVYFAYFLSVYNKCFHMNCFIVVFCLLGLFSFFFSFQFTKMFLNQQFSSYFLIYNKNTLLTYTISFLNAANISFFVIVFEHTVCLTL